MLGLRTTIYKVGDIQKATEWYSKAFETKPYFNETYYVGFNIKGYELGTSTRRKSDPHLLYQIPNITHGLKPLLFK
jgi:hypothetical protein